MHVLSRTGMFLDSHVVYYGSRGLNLGVHMVWLRPCI
jgi:hypothetical protein